MKLCVDVGNTTIYLGYYENNSIKDRIVFDTVKTADKSYFLEKIPEREEITHIFYSSVVPSVDAALLGAIKEKYPGAELLFVDSLFDYGLRMDIDNPSELGGDLYCDIIGAYNKYGNGPLLVVDMGTAIKFLFLEDGAFKSALIVPGIKLSMKSLFSNADLLPEVDISKTEEIKAVGGKNTISSITCGAILGHKEMINGLIERFKEEKENNAPMKVIFTGGDAPLFKPYFKNELYYFDDTLVLDGALVMLNKMIERR